MQPLGTPCWLDIETDNERARAFYGTVLGWAFRPFGEGWIASVGDVDVAGIGGGTPRPWRVFLGTADIDATVAAAVAAGGVVAWAPEAFDGVGTAGAITDPGGATVGLWQAGPFEGFETTGAHGTPVWFEVNTRDSTVVRDFFCGLFDLTHEQMPGQKYFMLHAEGRPRYGVLHMNEEWDGMDPSWMVYFAATDVDASAKAVVEAGGTVPYGPFDTPFGRIAICTDPMGSSFSLVTSG